MQQSSRAGLPRDARLRGRDSFGRLFREGEGLRRGQLVVKYRTLPHEPGQERATRVTAGFVVRRNSGSAPKRNRLKRLLRETYRLDRQRFIQELPPGLDLEVVILWSGTPDQALRPGFASIAADMGSALGAIRSRLRKRADGRAEGRP
jgi:ribonuclease P protein component